MLGAAKEVSLKERETVLFSSEHLDAGLNFLRQHAALRGGEFFCQSGVLFGGMPSNVDLEEIRKGDEGDARIVGNEVIERDLVAFLLHALARGAHEFVRRDGLLNLDDDFVGRQEQEVVLQQHLLGAIDEGEASVANGVEAQDIESVECVGGSAVGVGGVEMAVGGALAEQKFVSDDAFVFGKDRLTGEPRIGRFGG